MSAPGEEMGAFQTRLDRSASSSVWQGLLRSGWIFAVLMGVAALALCQPISPALEHLADREVELRQAYAQQPALVLLSIGALYVLVTTLPLPGAALGTLVTGWTCGFVPGLILVRFASTIAASLTFLACRRIRGLPTSNNTKGFGARLRELSPDDFVSIVFWLRLTPVIPFFAVNAGMALTPISPVRFWAVSQAAMLPISAVYVYAGSRVPHLIQLLKEGPSGVLSTGVLMCLCLLGGLPLLLRWLGRRGATARSVFEQHATDA